MRTLVLTAVLSFAVQPVFAADADMGRDDANWQHQKVSMSPCSSVSKCAEAKKAHHHKTPNNKENSRSIDKERGGL